MFKEDAMNQFCEIGKSLSSEKDAIKLLEMIINSSINLTSSDAGTIYLVIDGKSKDLSPIRNNSYQDKYLKHAIAKNMSMDSNFEAYTDPVTEKSICGYTAMTGESLRIDNVYNISPDLEYRHYCNYDLKTGYITKSMLSIPMKDHENNVMGVIQLINKKKRKIGKIDYSDKEALKNIITYNYTDELIMNSLGGQAAVALENSLLYRDMQNLLQSYKQQNTQLLILSKKLLKAHEEERRRIAREIHDGPAQSAVNLSLKLEICKRYFQDGEYEKFSREMDNLGNFMRSTSKEIRTIIYDLKPSFLEEGLIKAVESRLGIFMEDTGIEVVFSASGDDSKVEYYLASTVYRIIQGALSNIFKHACAKAVTIDFDISDKSIFIAICDDGKGFDVSELKNKKHPSREGGFGLEGIRERVELIRGNVTIKSALHKGTSIIINIPVLDALIT